MSIKPEPVPFLIRSDSLRTRHRAAQSGISLIELVMFMVIVSVGIVGILSVMNVTTQHSADPMPRKQALAVAEALLEEVTLMPFTDCEPDAYDPDLPCAQAEAMGPESGESRGSLTAPFDNVNDYNGLTLGAGSSDIGNSAAVLVPPGYAATIAVTPESLSGVDALRIAVTVSYNNGDSLVLEGYRTRYAPNGMP